VAHQLRRADVSRHEKRERSVLLTGRRCVGHRHGYGPRPAQALQAAVRRHARTLHGWLFADTSDSPDSWCARLRDAPDWTLRAAPKNPAAEEASGYSAHGDWANGPAGQSSPRADLMERPGPGTRPGPRRPALGRGCSTVEVGRPSEVSSAAEGVLP
jgi:hypothetical protein